MLQLRHTLATRPRVGQPRPPAVHHYSEPRFNNPRTSAREISIATIPRSHRGSDSYRQDGTSLSQNTRPDIRYEPQVQQSSSQSAQIRVPPAKQGVRRESTVRFEEPDRETVPRSQRYRHEEAVDDESESDISGTYSARQEPPHDRRRTQESTQSRTQPRRPSNHHRSSQASINSNPDALNYTLTSRERHATSREERSPRQDEPHFSRSRVYHEDNGRTERRFSAYEQRGPDAAQLTARRYSERASKYRDEDDDRDRISAAQAVTTNRRLNRESARDQVPNSRPHKDRRDSNLMADRYQSGSISTQIRDDRHSHDVSDPRRTNPTSPRDHRYGEADERYAQPRREEDRHPIRQKEQSSLSSSGGIWQPWDHTPAGRRYRLAYFEGKTALIQFDGSSGPYYDGNHKPVDSAKAAAVLAKLESLSQKTSVRDGGDRAPASSSDRPKLHSQRRRSSLDNSSGDEKPYPSHGSRHKDEGGHSTSGYRRSQRDSVADGLDRKMASASLQDKKPAAPKGPLPRRGGRGDPRDDDDIAGVFGARQLNSGSQRRAPPGTERSRRDTYDDDDLSGTSGPFRRGLLLRKVGKGDPNDDDDDDISGTFGARHPDPQRHGPGAERPRPNIDDDDDISGGYGARR